VRLLAALLFFFSTAPLVAQRSDAKLDVAVNPSAALVEGPLVSTSNLLADARPRDLLRQGFPTRIHYRLELWAKGSFINDLKGRAEWEVDIAYDPRTKLYNVVRRTTDDRLRENFGGFETVTSAEAQFSKPYRVALHPARGGRYYYELFVEVETLAETDLDALEQWMRGPTAPGNTSNPLTVVRGGVSALLSRVLGGETPKYRTTSPIFRVP
jgi:hypothetical protein